MRLSQFSKKTGATANQVVQMLNRQFSLELEVNPNLKLEEEWITFLLAELNTSLDEELKELTTKVENTDTASADAHDEPLQDTESKSDELVPANEDELKSDTDTATADASAGMKEETTEVTKREEVKGEETEENVNEGKFERGQEIPLQALTQAEHIEKPEIKLEGPTVVDKIELPDYELKKKEREEQRKKELEEKKKERERKKKQEEEKRFERYLKRKEQQQKREEQKRKRELKKQKKKEEAKRRQHYLEQLEKKKQKQEAAKAKKKSEEVKQVASASKAAQSTVTETETEELPTTEAKQPKSLLGRLWKWLTDA